MGSDKKTKKKIKEEETKPTKVIELKVELHCRRCAHKVISSLSKLRGVSKIDTDIEKNKVTVTGTVEEEELTKKIRKLGKNVQTWKDSSKSDVALAKTAGLKFTVMEQPGVRYVVVDERPPDCALM